VEIGDIQQTQLTAPESTPATEESDLGRDAFLRIFLAQLEHQDPLDPQDSSELGAQLAQFSQLEQSLRMTTELQGINSRLDELISATGASAPTLDPLAMIGRQVEVEGSSLRASEGVSSEVLRIKLERESELLGLVAQDPFDQFIGLSVPENDGPSVTFTAGTYELALVGNEPKLKTPAGQELPLELTALRENADGRLEADPDAAPVRLQAGTIYQFTVVAVDRAGQQFEPRTTTTGTVDGVRIVDGLPVLLVADQDIDPFKVVHIR